MKKQAEQFQTLVASYGKLYEAKKPEKESTKPNPRRAEQKRLNDERKGKDIGERTACCFEDWVKGQLGAWRRR